MILKNFSRLFFFISILVFSQNISAQKKKKTDIMQSTNIEEINEFLKTAHPDDVRIYLLQDRIVELKRAEMTRKAREAKPMAPRPIMVVEKKQEAPPQKIIKADHNEDEAEEFNQLISQNEKQYSDKAVKLLNNLFDEDITKTETIILLQNNTDCNLIVRISGNKSYKVAIPAHDKNSLVLEKGQYNFTSKVCGAQYLSTKNIYTNLLINIGNKAEEANNYSYSNGSNANNNAQLKTVN